jgi:hypothetical protein
LPWCPWWNACRLILAAVALFGLAAAADAQDPAGLEAHVGSAKARISVPLSLLQVERDSFSCLITWGGTGLLHSPGEMGLMVRVPQGGKERRKGHAVAVGFDQSGDLGVVILLRDTVRSWAEGSRLEVELGASTALNTLQGSRPDSLLVESPPWGFSQAVHAWIHPKYEL